MNWIGIDNGYLALLRDILEADVSEDHERWNELDFVAAPSLEEIEADLENEACELKLVSDLEFSVAG